MDEAVLASQFIKHKIDVLVCSPNAAVTLAILRRGIGKAPGSKPELWEATLNGLPDALVGETSSPSKGEWAVHTTLTLFALHQQGKTLYEKCMNAEGERLGLAVRKLVHNDDDEQYVKRRFDAAATSDGLIEISYHLRGLVRMFRDQDITLDYAALAADLFWFQIPEARDLTRLRWGRDFYHIRANRYDK
jgi:CRISPR system Cascade subunit CasB